MKEYSTALRLPTPAYADKRGYVLARKWGELKFKRVKWDQVGPEGYSAWQVPPRTRSKK